MNYEQAMDGPALREETQNRLATGLGWFSIGLGLWEVLAPGHLGDTIGVTGNGTLIQAMGAREIGAGLGILAQDRPAAWLWARVGGDFLDLALLGSALGSESNDRNKVLAAIAAVAGVTVLDILCAQQLTQTNAIRSGKMTPGGAIRVRRSITISRPAEQLYRFWHDFGNLPQFMKHLEAVHQIGDRRSHWIAKGPAGTTVEWDAEIVREQSGREIAWRSLPGADVDNAGSVRFEAAPGREATEVTVELQYTPPGGSFGALVAKAFGEEPEQQVAGDLRRFKQLMETGEIATTEGQPAGSSGAMSLLRKRDRRSE